ncbi:MAG: DsbA family protein [Desulfonatronovibrionaceae bacterium]
MKKIVSASFFCLIMLLPSLLMAQLNEEVLLENVEKRFKTIVQDRGGDPAGISADNMSIEKKHSFTVTLGDQTLTLYAVKVSLLEPESGQKQNVTLIVDQSAEVQLDGAFVSLKTGESLHQDVLDKLERLDREFESGDLLLTGQGDKEVVFLSDPFCPYCRRAYEYLIKQDEAFSRLKIAHFPISPDSGSVALTLLMMDHKDQDNFHHVVDFAYNLDQTELEGNADHQVIEKFNEKFNAFDKTPEQVFTDLQQKYQNKLAKDMQEMQDIGLTGTPVIIIDGVMVSGFNQNRIDKLLGQ